MFVLFFSFNSLAGSFSSCRVECVFHWLYFVVSQQFILIATYIVTFKHNDLTVGSLVTLLSEPSKYQITKLIYFSPLFWPLAGDWHQREVEGVEEVLVQPARWHLCQRQSHRVWRGAVLEQPHQGQVRNAATRYNYSRVTTVITFCLPGIKINPLCSQINTFSPSTIVTA